MSNEESFKEYTEEQIDSAVDAIDKIVTDGYNEPVEIEDFHIDSINNFGQVFSKQLEGLDPEPFTYIVTKIGVTTKDENENINVKEIDIYIIYSGKYWYLANPEFDAEETKEMFKVIEDMLDNPDDYLQKITVTNNAG
jgi:hypothetical protein